MKLWEDFFDLAAPEVPGCPFGVLENALRQGAIEFCEQSLAWEFDHPDVPVIAGQDVYLYAPPVGAKVVAVLWAKLGDRELECNIGEPDRRYWNWRDRTGQPDRIFGGPSVFTLYPKPDAAETLQLIVALRPSSDGPGVDDEIFDECREAIIHGALYRLMSSPKKPYTDLQMATYHQQQFAIKTGRAGVTASKHHTRAPLETTIAVRRVPWA